VVWPRRAGVREGEIETIQTDDLPFRDLAQALPTPCWISDADGEIVWVNDAWVNYTGLTVDEIGKVGLAGLHDPAMLPEIRRVWAQARTNGAPGEMVFPLKGRDGRFRQFHTRVTPIFDADHQLRRWFGTNTDVTDHAETTARLRSSQEQFKEIFEGAGDGVFVSDDAGRFVDVNRAGCELLGYSRTELLALSVADIIAAEDMPRSTSVGSRARDAAIKGDWRLRRKDGAWIDVEISARALSDGRQLAIVRDVTERKQAHERLLRQVGEETTRAEVAERQLQRFWDASRDLFVIVDVARGVPRAINAPAWMRTLGYSAEEIMGRRLMELVHPDDRNPTLNLDADGALSGGEAMFGFENRYRHADGRWVWLSWNIVREGGASFCIARDITEEKARAEHAARAQRLEALGQLTGGVAHDFNNLLTTILGSLDLMQRRPDDKKLRERLTMAALGAVRRGERLNGQLLSFARGHPGGVPAADVRQLLLNVKPLLESALGEPIVLNLDLVADVRGCAVEAADLETAVLNLVVNARDAMPSGGTVTIRTRSASEGELAVHGLEPGDYSVVEVIDTGIGMAPEVRAHAFEPFFTTKGVGKGVGLGLAQVYGVARRGGGTATVESEVDAGTIVRLYLRGAPLSPHDEPRAEPWAATGERVLLVEDDPLVAVVTETMLADLGYEVTRHAAAAEALESLRSARFDILLSDVRMPGGMSGLDLAKAAARERPDLKVLLCSGWAGVSLADELAGTAWRFLAKPFDGLQLCKALADLSAAAPPET
jgi:PAS domain S-box-containing protein